jgi:alkylation response protein AidB-like acyl-CoA dehydrogenase
VLGVLCRLAGNIYTGVYFSYTGRRRVQFAHSEEQQLIRASARDFLAAQAGTARRHGAAGAPGGYDAALWQQLAGELGWAGLALPERFGGGGLGWVELCILQEELGRQLVASPFFSTAALAAPLIAAAGSEQQCAQLLPHIAAGSLRVACALSGTDGRPPEDHAGVALRGDGQRGFTLEGVSDFVIHGDAADQLLVLARPAPGAACSLAVIAADAVGVRIEPHVMLDLTRPMARIEFAGVALAREQLLGEPHGAEAALATGLQRARIALAAECVGGAERVLEMTAEYARQRQQFGRAIGSFQAIKHRLADMMVEVEAAKSAAWYAACVADEQPQELPEAASIAKSYCADAYADCTAQAIQLHGGIGYTWEHELHLYFKRARASATLLGTPAWQRERLTRLIAGGASAVPLF